MGGDLPFRGIYMFYYSLDIEQDFFGAMIFIGSLGFKVFSGEQDAFEKGFML